MALRCGNWKIHFAEQRAVGADAWQDPMVKLKAPKLINLCSDPFEETAIGGGPKAREIGRLSFLSPRSVW
jgi:hypothetical protein